ncbi:hypothetical protein E5843_01455 [Luteimonas yindakuii]|uniref:hypothetical protein n=1 Tax=Luteimonas yindakuii TaxID=2565782 RepID=UPI0010A3EB6D|nr:hypothetical protein [Luteimonas yindakuii]QCO66790.1 hypothetical protein E5843_01455 [Luteimonas yindakuii]
MDNNARIMEIGRLIATDHKVAAAPWDGYALIVVYADGSRKLAGFRYRDGAPPAAATPEATVQLGEQLDALRAGTQVAGKAPWNACVVKIRRDTGRVAVDFDYDTPTQWKIGPETLHTVAERARPQ